MRPLPPGGTTSLRPSSEEEPGVDWLSLAEYLWCYQHRDRIFASLPVLSQEHEAEAHRPTPDKDVGEKLTSSERPEDKPPPLPTARPAAEPPQSKLSLKPQNRPQPTQNPEKPPSRAYQVPLSSPIPLPGQRELAKALRPLARRVRRGRLELDVEATVESTAAHGGFFLPQMKRGSQRWLEAELVVDSSDSVTFWQGLANEVERLLALPGAFRRIRRWTLREASGGWQLETAAGHVVKETSIANDQSSRCVLILTDALASVWSTAQAHALLGTWAARSPTVLLHLLPPRLWERTGLGGASMARISSPARGSTNAAWRAAEPGTAFALPPGLPLPCINFEASHFARLAGLLTGAKSNSVQGLLLPHAKDNLCFPVPAQASEKSTEAEMAEKVEQFFFLASREAAQLACYLAATPLVPPVMRMVQETFADSVRHWHLTEILCSGLVHQSPHLDEIDGMVCYSWLPKVQRMLLAQSPVSKTRDVWLKVGHWLAKQESPGMRRLAALWQHPQGTIEARFSREELFFAEVNAEVWQSWGGSWGALGRELAAKMDPNTGSGRAGLPSVEVLNACLLGVLSVPAFRLVRTLNEPASRLVRTLNEPASNLVQLLSNRAESPWRKLKSPPPVERTFEGVRILWVDHHVANFSIFRLEMENEGAEISIAWNNVRALEMLDHQTFDAVISDLDDGTSFAGLELLAKLFKGGYRTPFAIFDAEKANLHKAEALTLGALICTNHFKEVREALVKELHLPRLAAREEARQRIREWTSMGDVTSQLNLSDLGLDQVPLEIFGLSGLQRLDLSNNQLASLPTDISQLADLRALSLNGNRLIDLPEAIAGFVDLMVLDLSDNQLRSLPLSISSLSKLSSLSLNNNLLTSLPSNIGQLSTLTCLFLHYNQLTGLPPEIGLLSSLKTLSLSHNKLTNLPSEIRELTALDELYLHDNPGLNIPDDILGPNHILTAVETSEYESVAPQAILDYYFGKSIPPAQPPRILWVDDKPHNNDKHCLDLEEDGFQVIKAPSTGDALAIIKEQTFDAIISDLGRPEGKLAGFDLLRQLRESGNRTPFAIFSAPVVDYLEEAERLGALVASSQFRRDVRTALIEVAEAPDGPYLDRTETVRFRRALKKAGVNESIVPVLLNSPRTSVWEDIWRRAKDEAAVVELAVDLIAAVASSGYQQIFQCRDGVRTMWASRVDKAFVTSYPESLPGVISRCEEGGETVYEPDIKPPSFPVAVTTTRSKLALPLLDDTCTSVIGLINIESELRHRFNPQEIAWLEGLAASLGPAIQGLRERTGGHPRDDQIEQWVDQAMALPPLLSMAFAIRCALRMTPLNPSGDLRSSMREFLELAERWVRRSGEISPLELTRLEGYPRAVLLADRAIQSQDSLARDSGEMALAVAALALRLSSTDYQERYLRTLLHLVPLIVGGLENQGTDWMMHHDYLLDRDLKLMARWKERPTVPVAEAGPLWPDGMPANAVLEDTPRKWVMVAGGGYLKQPDHVLAGGRELGTALASGGFGLFCGGWPGVDHVVAESFVKRFTITGNDLSRFALQVVEPKFTPSFEIAKAVFAQTPDQWFGAWVKQADAVILMSGSRGTKEVGEAALEAGLWVLPIAATGGAAETFHRQILEQWSTSPLPGLTLSEFESLAAPVPQAIDNALRLLPRAERRAVLSDQKVANNLGELLRDSALGEAIDKGLAWLEGHANLSLAYLVINPLLHRQDLSDSELEQAIGHATVWLQNHGSVLKASLVLASLLGRQVLPEAVVNETINLALVWLRAHDGLLEAEPVLQSLLDRKDLRNPFLNQVNTHALAWLRVHKSLPRLRFVLQPLLNRHDLDGPALTQAVADALDWLRAYESWSDAVFVLTPLLSRQDLTGTLLNSATTHALTWLKKYGNLPEAEFVLQPLLKRQGLNDSDVDQAISYALAWLQDHGTSLEANFVLTSLLDREGLVDPGLDQAVVDSLVWLQIYINEQEAQFVLTALLRRKDMQDSFLLEAINQALSWLQDFDCEPESCFVLQPLLDRQDLREPALDDAILHALAWLGANEDRPQAEFVLNALLNRLDLLEVALDKTVNHALVWLRAHGDKAEAGFVLAALLQRSALREGTLDQTISLALVWLRDHEAKPEARFVLAAALDRPDLRKAALYRTIAHALVWLQGHKYKSEAKFVLAALLDCRNLRNTARDQTIAHALFWLKEYGTLPEAASVFTSLLNRQGIAPKALNLAIDQARTWMKLYPTSPDTLLVRKALQEVSDINRRITVLITDDNDLVRDNLMRFLDEQVDMEVVGGADDGLKAVELVKQLRPDVVIISLPMHVHSEVEAPLQILANEPDTKIIVTTAFPDQYGYIEAAAKVGAAGYIVKDTGDWVYMLPEAVREVFNGGTYFPADGRKGKPPPRQSPVAPRRLEKNDVDSTGLSESNQEDSPKTIHTTAP